MKRTTPHRKVTAILTSDWHLSENPPVCRTDEDWWGTMKQKLDYIRSLQEENNGCLVYHAGDLFDNWKPSPALLTFAMQNLPEKFTTILGNHDLPQHNLGLFDKTGIATLAESNYVFVSDAFHWGMDPMIAETAAPLIMAHIMTYPTGLKSWPNQTDPPAGKLLRKINVPLIVTGHNHHGFTETYKDRLLVNPGSIFRLTADQIDYKPRVYLWYDNTNEVEAVYLPIKKYVSREHLDVKKAKDDRIKQFIERLHDTWEPKFSLEENLRVAFAENETPQRVQEIIWKALEDK